MTVPPPPSVPPDWVRVPRVTEAPLGTDSSPLETLTGSVRVPPFRPEFTPSSTSVPPTRLTASCRVPETVREPPETMTVARGPTPTVLMTLELALRVLSPPENRSLGWVEPSDSRR